MRALEDEVDWSDGTLNSPPALPAMASLSGAVQPIAERLPEMTVEHKTANVPLALPAYLQQLVDAGCRISTPTPRVTIPPNGNPKIPQDSRDSLADFIHYQANQRVYETTFLKAFVTHSLHSNTLGLGDSLADRPDVKAMIERYLQTVSEHVVQLADRIVWNTHYKTIHFLGAGKLSVAFLDVDRFKKDLFDGYRPYNPYPVVQQMNQSWHRTGSRLGMVQYSAADYPIERRIARSPFEEIGEASRALVRRETDEVMMPNGRVFTFHPTTTGNNRQGQSAKRAPPNSTGPTKKLEPHSSALTTLRTFGEIFPNRNITHLEACLSNPSVDLTTALLDHHKRQLEERGRLNLNQFNNLPQDIQSVIARAVAKNILKPPTPNLQKAIDKLATKQSLTAPPITLQIFNRRCGATNVPKQRRGRLPGITQTTSSKRKRVSSWNGPNKRTCVLSEAGTLVRDDDDNNNESGLITQPEKSSRTSSRNLRFVKLEDLPPHASGSRTLEPHQALPPGAYFKKKEADEQLAWRCGILHPLGHYYNAGDRKSCPGCFTNIKYMRPVQMDFYMPRMTWFAQEAPGMVWKPRPKWGAPLTSKRYASHNAHAKRIYWQAIETNATEDEARQQAVESLTAELLKPKPRLEKERAPTPDPSGPEPSPQSPIDLGPHPSGSTTMEHGQDIPRCAYFEKKCDNESVAWRCDTAHSLGRYYIAGNRRSCPGCRSYITGTGKVTYMDFYMPLGAVVWQEAPGLVSWTPRRPYKRKGKSSGIRQFGSHNQIAADKFWKAVDEEGLEYNDALAKAIRETDKELNGKYLKSVEDDARQEDEESAPEELEQSAPEEPAERAPEEPDLRGLHDSDQPMDGPAVWIPDNGYTHHTTGFARKAPTQQSAQHTVVISSDESSSDDLPSGSDSE